MVKIDFTEFKDLPITLNLCNEMVLKAWDKIEQAVTMGDLPGRPKDIVYTVENAVLVFDVEPIEFRDLIILLVMGRRCSNGNR